METRKGVVYLIGAGPGDPELITVKAQKIIARADCIVCDRLASSQILYQARPDAEFFYVGKESSNHTLPQDEINKKLVELALQNKTVVRLKGGDPFVFGRGGEEILVLEEHNIPYFVIPGITSAIAALENVGIPVTHRRTARSFQVITGHTCDDDLTEELVNYARSSGTLVVLMGVKNLVRIAEILLSNRKDPETPVSIIENATTVAERRVDTTLKNMVADAERKQVKAPAIIVFGDVCRFSLKHKKFMFSELNIAVTGTLNFSLKLTDELQQLGARVLNLPNLEVFPVPSIEPWLNKIGAAEWLVFTSANGVNVFRTLMQKGNVDLRILLHKKFAVVGTGTCEALKSWGFIPDFIPGKFDVATLSRELVPVVGEKSVCVLRSSRASRELNECWDNNGIDYCDCPIYEVKNNHWPRYDADRYLSRVNYLIFASSSGVDSFFENSLNEIYPQMNIVAIGTHTAELVKVYMEELNLKNKLLIAGEYSRKGIIEIIKEDLSELKNRRLS